MHAPGLRVGHLRQLVGVGGLELGQTPPLQQHLGQRVVQRQLLQHALVGGWLAGRSLLHHRQPQPLEEDLAQLLGGAQVEGLAGQFVRLPFQLLQLFGQLLRLGTQPVAVQQHAVALHVIEHLQRGHLDVAVDVAQPFTGLDGRPQRAMQLQRHVGVLGRVGGGHVQCHLVEADGLGALARHFLVGDGGAIQMASGQRIHAVGAVRLQHVGLQHRVIDHAAQRDAVIGQHVHVVLDVLAHLLRRIAFQPGLQHRQHLVQRQLFGHARIVVPHRDVATLPGRHGQRDAHQPRRMRIQRGGLGVDGHPVGHLHARQPRIQRRARGHRLGLQLARGRCFQHDAVTREVADAAGQRFQPRSTITGRTMSCPAACRAGRYMSRRALPSRSPLTRSSARGTRDVARARLASLPIGHQPAREGTQLPAIEQSQQRLLVLGTQLERLHAAHPGAQVGVTQHRHQLAAARQPVARCAQVLAHLALDLVGVLQDGIQRAVFVQPLGGRLGAHLVHARHVVHRIAGQRQEIDDLPRIDAELVAHAGSIHHRGRHAVAGHRVDQQRLVINELRQILVAGGDDGAHAGGTRAGGQRADHVIGLDARHHQQRPAQRLGQFMDGRDLRHQRLGRLAAVGLVVLVQVVAEGAPRRIEDHCAQRGAPVQPGVVAQPTQHADHPMDGTGRLARLVAQVRQGMIGAKQVAGAIDQQQGLGVGHRETSV